MLFPDRADDSVRGNREGIAGAIHELGRPSFSSMVYCVHRGGEDEGAWGYTLVR